MPLDLLGEIHSSTGVLSGDWRTYREEVTGMYLLSGGLDSSPEWYAMKERETSGGIPNLFEGY